MRIIEAIPIKNFKHKIQLTKKYERQKSKYKRIEVYGDVLYLERRAKYYEDRR